MTTGDASPLLQLTPKMRQHSMRALASLAKYRGVYDRWQAIVKNHQLSWSVGTDAFNQSYFESMITGENQLPELLQQLKDYCKALAPVYCNTLLLMVMSGMRIEEHFEAMKLLQSGDDTLREYVLQKGNLYLLQNYKHSLLFLRRTKKSFVSILPEPAYRLALATEPVNRNALRLAQQRLKLPAISKSTRKIYGTVLRQAGLEAELVDAMSGRVPTSVFAKHYLKSGLPIDRLEKAIGELWQIVQPLVK